jgi:CRP/FNR family cyclic AMP-dependent transcriptional regulator
VHSPYNLALQNDCLSCPLRHDRRFCDLSESGIAALNALKFSTVYPKGATLFVEGEMARGVFILCAGKVKLTTSSGEGKTLILKVAAAGEILGVSATILNKPYEVSAETMEPSHVNFIRHADFLALLHSQPDVCLRTAEQLSGKYQEAQREVRSLGLSQTTSEKLARLLLEWSNAGEKTAKGIRVKVLMTHEEIGQMLGTTRETITRLLGDFRRRKIIDVTGSSLYVTRRESLEQMTSF